MNIIPLYTAEEYEKAKSEFLLPLSCNFCAKTFYKKKKIIQYYAKTKNGLFFCSKKCNAQTLKKIAQENRIILKCLVCLEPVTQDVQKNTKRKFCSRNCKLSYFEQKFLPYREEKREKKAQQSKIQKEDKLRRKELSLTGCCHFCKNNFTKTYLKSKRIFCSRTCSFLHSKRGEEKRETVECNNCKEKVIKMKSETKKYKTHFCSLSCSTTYHNQHTKRKSVRSAFELYCEEQLPKLYPNDVFEFNNREKFGVELDIYSPTINVAIELNGPVHYIPIFGQEKLDRTVKNDNRKAQLCIQEGINFGKISVMKMKSGRNQGKDFEQYLGYIIDIIEQVKKGSFYQEEEPKLLMN